MKHISKEIRENIILIALITASLFASTTPFLKVITILLALVTVVTLSIMGNKKNNPCNLKSNRNYLLLIGFFLFYVIGCLYSSNMNSAYESLKIKLPLLLFPLIFSLTPKNILNTSNIQKIALSFIIGLFIYELYLLTLGTITWTKSQSSLLECITYCNLAYKSHPAYLALYSSVALLLIDYLHNKNIILLNKKISSIVYYLLFFFFTIFIGLISSKAAIISLILVLSYIIIISLINHKCRKALIIIIFLSSLIISIFSVPILNRKSKEFIAIANAPTSAPKNIDTTWEGVSRKFTYIITSEYILRNNIFGVGTGDVEKELSELYKDEGAKFSRYYNAHNQFLETGVALGIIGLAFLLLIFIFPFIDLLKTKDFHIIAILGIIFISFLFESMLQRQMGVHFFGFIYSWIAAFIISKKQEIYQKTKSRD